MTTTPTPNWYDVLDVDPSATTDEIRDAWRAAIADLTPADRRFRLYNQAAEVLLDPERRAAHDADLAREDDHVVDAPEPVAHPAAARRSRREALAVAPAALRRALRRRRPAEATAGAAPAGAAGRVGWYVPTALLVGLAVLTALALGVTAYLWSQPSPEAVDEAVTSARNTAESSIEPLLSYDYRDLEGSREAAEEVITDGYRSEYEKFYDGVVKGNAERTKTVVQAKFVASAVVRGGVDRVELLLFVDQATRNIQVRKPIVYRNQARVIMERVGDEWLIDCVLTKPDGECES